jgi:ligand-binding SRPBCC domain-containing protein
MAISLRFESTLKSSPAQVWRWITDVRCLRKEMRPWLWMSIPWGIRNLEDVELKPGQPLFTSWLWLFGLVPIGKSKLTLLEITPGVGFVEQSPMTGTRLWRHERRLEAFGTGGTRVVDQLTVEPLFAGWAVRGFLHIFFASRHRALRARDRRQLHT